jgi:hypothetical protein
MPDSPPAQEITADQAAEVMGSRRYVALLVIVAVVGVVVSFATWGFLELIYQITRELYTHLPNALGYTHGPPVWWPLPILGVSGVLVALAITRLPGSGGHVPAEGLAGGKPTTPVELPGVLLAGLAGIGFGIVLGPEARSTVRPCCPRSYDRIGGRACRLGPRALRRSIVHPDVRDPTLGQRPRSGP